MSIRDRKHRWVRRARLLMALELLLSVIFDLTMIGSVKKGHTLNCLLIVVITLNILTAGRLFLKLRGIKCASSIMAYVIWKIVQEVVMVPALVVFSFICVDKYLRSWENVNQGVRILVIVWTYAIYSLFLIIFLGWLARFLWVLQTNSRNAADKNGENATTISFIDGFHDDQELLDATVPPGGTVGTTVTRNTVEMMEMRDMRTSSRPFVPYDNVVPYISN